MTGRNVLKKSETKNVFNFLYKYETKQNYCIV